MAYKYHAVRAKKPTKAKRQAQTELEARTTGWRKWLHAVDKAIDANPGQFLMLYRKRERPEEAPVNEADD